MAISRKREDDEAKVLISEVLIRNKDGEGDGEEGPGEDGGLSVLTMREVQEDVHRIVEGGLFKLCMPLAVKMMGSD